jgi:hypothetical protein
MKAITIRPTEMMNPEYDENEMRKAQLADRPYRVKQILMTPPGREIDHPACWRLVNMGLAVPLDDECREAAGMSDDELCAAIANYELTEQGRVTGKPEYDAARKPSGVVLPSEFAHLADPIAAEIERRQKRIDELHNVAKQEEAEDKAEGKIMYVVDVTDLPPDVDDLPPEE